VEIIVNVFQLNNQGKSGWEIADFLNQKGYLRRNGRPWTQRQVCSILNRRELYQKGVIKYGEIKGGNRDLVIVREDSLSL